MSNEELEVTLHLFGTSEDHLVVASKTVVVAAWDADGTRKLFAVVDRDSVVNPFTFAEGVLSGAEYQLQDRWHEGAYGRAQYAAIFVPDRGAK